MSKQISILFVRFALVLAMLSFHSIVDAQDDLYDTTITTETYTTEGYDSTLFNLTEQRQVEARRVDEKELNKLKKDEAFWYLNEKPKESEEEKPKPSSKPKKKSSTDKTPVWEKGWFKTAMWILIGLTFIAIIFMFLSASDVFVFKKKQKKTVQEEENLEMPEDIFSIPYEKEIQQAIAKGDYRLAIRYLYLRTLKDLTDNGLIQYKQDKTNQEYVMQLYGTAFYKEFFQLTRHFEYAWYGKFEITAEAFEKVHNQFKSFEGGKAA